LRQAEIDLSYTEIRAPFAGQIGRASFAEGAVVGPASESLGRLVRLDPIFVAVPVTDRQMLEVRQAQSSETEFEPFLRLADGSMLETPGRWAFFDPQVNATTSTITVRATFDNPDGLLLPGQFVTVVVRAAEPEAALVIPQIAVQRDQSGEFVLVVDEANRVQETRVKLGDRVDTDWVVEGGLEEGQNVIVEGLQKVRPGVLVQATGLASDEG
jgi:membrane fusion protein (multidrug efflux system)